MDGFDSNYLVDKYDEYLKLVEFEKAKGERVSKRTQAFLYDIITSAPIDIRKAHLFIKYSSGKKVSPFDAVAGAFLSLEPTSPYNTNVQPMSFCEEEIESYARSYRVYSDRYLIKVFEFRKDKI